MKSTMNNTIDLSLIPPPHIVETLSYEKIVDAMIQDLKTRYNGTFSALLESDPAYKIIEVCAYRELLVRQRVNDGAKAVMIAYASGTDLDNLGALFNVKRHIINPGDETAQPPVLPKIESDTDFRRRILLAMEGITTAGSKGSYIFNALKAHKDVLDVSVESPDYGKVNVTVLVRQVRESDQDVEYLETVRSAVETALCAEDVRPLTDHVNVKLATAEPYTIKAKLTLKDGISPEIVKKAADESVKNYCDGQFRLGASVPLSGIYAAIHQQSGVMTVTIDTPDKDIESSSSSAPKCDKILLEVNDV